MGRSIFSRIKGGSRTAGHTGLSFLAHGVSIARIERAPHEKRILSRCGFTPARGLEQQAEALKALVDAHKLADTHCTLVLEPGEYSLVQVDKPPVEDAELRDALRWRIKELLDFPVEEAIIDAFDVPGQAQRGRSPSVYVVAARKALLEPRIAMVQAAGLQLDQIDIAELALRNLAAASLPEEETGGLLYLTPHRGLITIVRGQTLYVARGIDRGLEQLLDQAEAAGGTDLAPVSDILEVYGQLALEIQRTMDYYDSYFGEAPVKRVLIAPALEALEELAQTVGEHLGMRTEVLSLSDWLEPAEGVQSADIPESILALGGALSERTPAE